MTASMPAASSLETSTVEVCLPTTSCLGGSHHGLKKSVTAAFLVLVGGGVVSGGAANGLPCRRREMGATLSSRAGPALREVYGFERLKRRIRPGMGDGRSGGRCPGAAVVARNLVCFGLRVAGSTCRGCR